MVIKILFNLPIIPPMAVSLSISGHVEFIILLLLKNLTLIIVAVVCNNGGKLTGKH